jgi:ribosomal protein L7/L12
MRPSIVIALVSGVVLVAMVLALVATSRSRRRERRSNPFAPTVYGTPEERIMALAHSGQKIAAIKLLREHTGLGLAEAKRAVEEAVQAGHLRLPPHMGGRHPGPAGLARLNPDLLGEAAFLKQRGQAIEAIKLIRQHTGLGLKESKDIYDLL